MQKLILKLKSLIPQRLRNFYHLLIAIGANLYYRNPSRKLFVIGVTGTDGKTTTVNLIYHLLKTAGKKVSLISTVKAIIGEEEYHLGFHVTTPDPREIQKFISLAALAGSEYLILETTSHALDQFRVWGVNFRMGVLTNITSEHLDYHKNYENYLQSKAKLFKKTALAILNADDPSFAKLKSEVKGRVLSYGIKKSADVMAIHIRHEALETRFDVTFSQAEVLAANQWGQEDLKYGNEFELGDEKYLEYPIRSNLLGEFNINNILAAIACVLKLNLSPQEIMEGIQSFMPPQGRMERVETGRDFEVMIDFAHTPGAFEKVLPFVKSITRGRLVHVFGAAGLRDFAKRPKMGAISAQYADLIVLTAEDPRTEDVNQIMSEIASGAKKDQFKEVSVAAFEKSEKGQLFLIPDRQDAIEFAVRKLAQRDDLIFISGKGHETSMCLGHQEFPWSERKAVVEALKERKDF